MLPALRSRRRGSDLSIKAGCLFTSQALQVEVENGEAGEKKPPNLKCLPIISAECAKEKTNLNPFLK